MRSHSNVLGIDMGSVSISVVEVNPKKFTLQ